MLGEKLLRLRDPSMEPHKISSLIEELTTKLYYHGHPIARSEAKEDLGLPVDEPKPPVEKAIWDLYLAYERELKMDVQFDAVSEALAATSPQSGTATTAQPGQTWSVTKLRPLRLAIVEAKDHGDVFSRPEPAVVFLPRV
jgi:hypothetical protein